MSVLICGMDMPSCCYRCVNLDDGGDYPRCRITDEQRGYNFDVYNNVMRRCPLVRLPKIHGRLIDADELIKQSELYLDNMSNEFFKVSIIHIIKEIVSNTPTVIEREVQNERALLSYNIRV